MERLRCDVGRYFSITFWLSGCILLLGCECRRDHDGDGAFTGDAACFLGDDVRDCDDTDPFSRPGFLELINDDRDNDCDGQVDELTRGDICDEDGDGSAHPICNGGDCNDRDNRVYDRAPEDPFDGVDNNCDRGADEQGLQCPTFVRAVEDLRREGPIVHCLQQGPDLFSRYDAEQVDMRPLSIPVAIHVFHDDHRVLGRERTFMNTGTPERKRRAQAFFQRAVDLLNRDLEDLRVSFWIESVHWLGDGDSAQYVDMNIRQDYDQVAREYHVEGRLNLFFFDGLFDTLQGQQAGAHSFGLERNHQSIVFPLNESELVESSRSLSHHVGHLLGLLHPYDDLRGEERADQSQCRERGDLLCDTEPLLHPSACVVDRGNPAMCVLRDCGVDSAGTPYISDAGNIMNLIRGCETHFSVEQKQVMQCTLWNQYPDWVVSSLQHECGQLRCDLAEEGDPSRCVDETAAAQVPEPICGNGIVEGNEFCDLGDENFNPDSTCDALCTPQRQRISSSRLILPDNRVAAGQMDTFSFHSHGDELLGVFLHSDAFTEEQDSHFRYDLSMLRPLPRDPEAPPYEMFYGMDSSVSDVALFSLEPGEHELRLPDVFELYVDEDGPEGPIRPEPTNRSFSEDAFYLSIFRARLLRRDNQPLADTFEFNQTDEFIVDAEYELGLSPERLEQNETVTLTLNLGMDPNGHCPSGGILAEVDTNNLGVSSFENIMTVHPVSTHRKSNVFCREIVFRDLPKRNDYVIRLRAPGLQSHHAPIPYNLRVEAQ